MPADASDLQVARVVDALCDKFEGDLGANQLPVIETFLVELQPEARAALLVELLGLELDYRLARGQQPDLGEYAARFPEFPIAQLENIFNLAARNTKTTPTPIGGVDSRLQTGLSLTNGVGTTDETVAGGVRRVRYFGDYELLREVARGGMGVVFEAQQRSLNRPVALKMLLSGRLASREEVARFHREAEAAARLEHPNIVPIYEIGTDGDQHYFTMGFVTGPSLSAQLMGGPLEPRVAAVLVREVALAVQYAHERGVVHRDLKPSNILLGPRLEPSNGLPFSPRVTDFGLAKFAHADLSLTETGQILGTPGYMPPEQAAGRPEEVGAGSDVYALGAVLYACLTGRPPFQASSLLDTVRQVREREPLSLRGLNRVVPRDLETICLKCLEKPIPRRYPSAKALADDLQRFLDGHAIEARPVSRWEHSWRWIVRNSRAISLISAGLFVLLIAMGIAAERWSKESQARAELGITKGTAAAAATKVDSYATLEKIRSRREARVAGWAETNRADLRRIAASPNGREFDMRCEAAAAAVDVDLQHARTIEARCRPYDVAFDPTGRLLAIGGHETDSAEATVQIVDWEQGLDVRTFPIPIDNDWKLRSDRPEGCWSILFSPDGRHLVVGTRSGWLMAWDLNLAGQEPIARWRHVPLSEPPGPPLLDRISRLAFGPDGQLFSGDDQTVATWNPSHEWQGSARQEGILARGVSGKPTRQPEIRRHAAAIHPSPNMIIHAENYSFDLVVYFNGHPGETLVQPNSDHSDDGQIGQFAVSPDGTLLAASAEHAGHLKLWELTGSRLLSARTLAAGSLRMAFHPTGRHLAVAEDQCVQIFDIAKPTVADAIVIQPCSIHDADMTPDARHVATAMTVSSPARVTEVQFHDLTRPALVSGLFRQQGSRPKENRRRLAIAPGGTQVTVNCNTFQRMTIHESEQEYFAGPLDTQEIRYSPSGDLWAIGTNHVRLWPHPASLAQFVETTDPWVNCVAVGAVGTWVGKQDGTLSFYSAAGKKLRSVPVGGGAIKAMAWDGSDRMIVGMSTGEVVILQSERVIHRISQAHRDTISAIAIGPHGFFATGSANREVTVWNPVGTAVVTLPQTRPVRRLFWSPDGRTLTLLASGERGLRQWHIDKLKDEFTRLGIKHSLPDPVSIERSDETPRGRLPEAVASQTAAVKSKGLAAGATRDDNRLKIKLHWCPPGEFLMGEAVQEPNLQSGGEPTVPVTLLRGFWMGETEVTQDQFQQLLQSAPWKNCPGTGDDLVREGSDYAATCLTWGEATDFARAFTRMERAAGRLPNSEEYRLPTEAEWEYACRAGTETQFWFGDDPRQLREYDWCRDNAYVVDDRYVQRVGLKKANAWGLHDMHGNVAEWCRDWYGDKLVGGVDPENAVEASNRVFRGGCWYYGAAMSSSGYRNWTPPATRFHYLGFRIVRAQSGR